MTTTDDRMALLELIEKRADADLVRTMLAFAAERLMDLEVEARTGVPAGLRSPDRINHRNDFRDRAWDTTAQEDLGGHPPRAEFSRDGAPFGAVPHVPEG